jgi:hypothetical protein
MDNTNLINKETSYEFVESINTILETNLPKDELEKITIAAAKCFQTNNKYFQSKPKDELYGIGHMDGFYAAYSQYAYGEFKEIVEPHDERTIAEDIPVEIKSYAIDALIEYYKENKKPLNSLIPQELYIIAYRNGYEQGSLIFNGVEKYRKDNKNTFQ